MATTIAVVETDDGGFNIFVTEDEVFLLQGGLDREQTEALMDELTEALNQTSGIPASI